MTPAPSTNRSQSQHALASAVRALAREERRAARCVMKLILDDAQVRGEVERRLGWGAYVRDDRYRTLMTLEWADGPPAIRRAVSIWECLPSRLDALLATYGWPRQQTLPTEVDAALWVLVLHADRNVEARNRWLNAARDLVPVGGVDSYFLAVALDHAEAVASNRQLYGTMTKAPGVAAMLLPLHDPDALEQRRSGIGLPPLAHDLRQGINYATVGARLARLARF